ncbi:hypothetical protein CEUSTIGMA_g6638.t1 [Chlamydomonas eustigma]|uniref:NAD(P)-binding domain-containing protein n=1 Tax=Chlamydomonas eustigma TaxID=1157962 RepID=A0A250X7Y8_9CHLO|nr:hypothetical protein CEUSTIGMA_g6638.t1 [Chlamydomonas eustigma]|eukprot:GAX79198.1 hypothetical protein CEUSTIGMA_g6638.t1 [Chlamydomonas eustigma]
MSTVEKEKMVVVVTGAAGKTGGLVAKKLAERSQFTPRAVVRSEQSKGKVTALGVKPEDVFFVDVAAGKSGDYAKAFEGADALVIATSGVPQIVYLSLIKVFWAKLTGQQGVRPEFTWKQGQMPEQVDWLGQKAQVDAAKAAGIKRVVVVGSMGGTQPENFLNTLGNGNILKWKRRAEQYLIESGVPYTIIHPGGLLDEEGGQRQLKVDVDDKMLQRKVRSIPRGDVAELCVQCLNLPEAENRAFDVIALQKEESEGPTNDWKALIDSLAGANCDYNIERQV